MRRALPRENWLHAIPASRPGRFFDFTHEPHSLVVCQMPAPETKRAKAVLANGNRPAAARGSWLERLRRPGFICLCLGLLTVAVYSPVAWQGFVNYDDSDR